MLNWLVSKHGIEPHIPVFDKSQHADGTFSRDDFATTTPLIPTSARPGKPSSIIAAGSQCRGPG
jgi:hypothetical protein